MTGTSVEAEVKTSTEEKLVQELKKPEEEKSPNEELKKTEAEEKPSKEELKKTKEENNSTKEQELKKTKEENNSTKEQELKKKKEENNSTKEQELKKTKEEKKSAKEQSKTVKEPKDKDSAIKVKDYIDDLLNEQKKIDKDKCPKIYKLVDEKLKKLNDRGKINKYADIMRGKYRLIEKVLIPNSRTGHIVGKLIGTKGSNLKKLEKETKTRLTVRGKGSVADRKKEAELSSLLDPKYDHLSEDLHMEIFTEARPDEAHVRVSKAIQHLRQCFINLETNGSVEIKQTPQVWKSGSPIRQSAPPNYGNSPPQFPSHMISSNAFDNFTHQQQPNFPNQYVTTNFLQSIRNDPQRYVTETVRSAKVIRPDHGRDQSRYRSSPYERSAPVRRVIELRN